MTTRPHGAVGICSIGKQTNNKMTFAFQVRSFLLVPFVLDLKIQLSSGQETFNYTMPGSVELILRRYIVYKLDSQIKYNTKLF